LWYHSLLWLGIGLICFVFLVDYFVFPYLIAFRDKSIGETRHVTIRDHGMTIVSSSTNYQRMWSDFRRARENKHFFYLDPPRRQKGAILNKASFKSVDDLSRFHELLQAQSLITDSNIRSLSRKIRMD
jgi:hypothetical protein